MSKHDKFTPSDTDATPVAASDRVPEWIKLTEVQRYFSVHRNTVYNAEKRGKIRIYRESGSHVRRVDMEKWLEGGV
ncbi:helix-turn-helix domain-containing protein [Thioclava sp. GXIMD4215]|uniref:helix-turn-helix domain-containing protein n=1 Tax=Thioclava sp. GXIMD4215 TaxID=3131928 RepID=UPI0032451BF2